MYAEETIHYYWENECKAATLAYGDEAYPVHGGLSVRPPTPSLASDWDGSEFLSSDIATLNIFAALVQVKVAPGAT